jgi:hypothetical protein
MADIASMDEEINKLYDTQAELGKLPETPETDEVMLANHKLIIQMEHNKAESMRRLQSVSQEAKKLPIENLAKYFPAKALESMTRDKMDKLINLQGRFDKLRSEIEAGARSLSRNDLKRKLGEAAGIRDEQNVIIGVGPRARQRAARNVASINEERKATSLQRLMHTNLPAGQEEKLSALERKMLALEKARPMDPKWFGGDRAIAQAYVDTFAPVMPSQYKGMAERRVAEQAKRARPAGQEFVGKAQRAVEQMSPSVPNLPSTEREAIGKLSQAELGFRESPAGRALAQQAGQARGQVKRSTHLLEGENLTERVRADLDVLNHPKLGPLTQTKEMVTNVEEALTNKSHLTKIRNDANAQAKSMLNPKAPGKSVEKGTIIQSIRDVARANPDMLDDNLSSTEALLDSAGKTYDRVVGLRSNVKEVEQMMDAATRKKGLPDVLLTTIGGNFSMIYDATGGKAAALKSGDYYVSNQLHEMMTNLFDISKEPGKFWRAVSTLTNIFKTYATLSPGFHVRNAMSAVFMNLSDGVRLGTQIEAAGLWQQYRKQGDPWLAKQTPEIKEAFSAAWNSGAGGRFTEAGFAQGGKSTVAEWLLSNKGTRLSQRVGERVEGSVRLAMGLDSVRKGESVDQAVARISRIHFDYADISKFDERAKQIVPFWTFLSRNLPLQMSQMWMRPKAYLTYEHFINNMASENDAFTPKYWLDAGAWNTGMTVPGEQTEGGPQGLPIYLQPDFGFTRIGADVADLQDALKGDFGAMLSNVNPLFTAPLEYASGRNFYTGQVYDEQSYSSQSGPLGTPIKWLAEALGQTNTSGQVSDKFANLLTSINPVQDRASRLFPALTGGDNPDKQRQLESIARYIGVPARTLTDKQRDSEFWRRFYETQDRQKALRVAQREVATGG